jgi:hypothetical protein
VRLEELGKLKTNPPHPGLEPATFQLVAQCLNQLRYRVHPNLTCKGTNTVDNNYDILQVCSEYLADCS